jgi:hypothetical protein
MIFFSSIVSADNEIVTEEVQTISCERMQYMTIRGDSVPVLDPDLAVIYPIENFILIEEEAK